MSQMTFSDYEYSLRKRKTKREEFLDIMNEIIPWKEWVEFVRPYYPNGKRGRPTKGIEKMLRMYLLQIWFNLSDEGVEDAIYDSYAFRKFMNIDFMEEQVPDATTLLKFRHLLEENHLGEVFFKAINRVMESTWHIMHGGTIVDATIISAPSSTKNAEKKRDPEMHQTKKGNVWKFGMKCHIGTSPFIPPYSISLFAPCGGSIDNLSISVPNPDINSLSVSVSDGLIAPLFSSQLFKKFKTLSIVIFLSYNMVQIYLQNQ